MKSTITKALVLAGLVTALPAAHAGEREELETLRQTTLNLIQALVQGGILTQDRADALIAQAQRQAADAVAAREQAESKVVRVPYVPQHVRDEIKAELRQEVLAQAKGERWAVPDAVPSWVNRLKWSGDLRLRHQVAYQSENNAPYLAVQETNAGDGAELLNTTDNITQERLRLRLGVEATLSESVSAGARISTGNTSNPVSTNQTLGQGLNRYSLVLDQAWIAYRPVESLTISGGRIPRPFLSTDLVWDEDLGFEGIAASYKPRLGAATQGFLTAGVFPLESLDCGLATQTATCNRDKRLYGVQAGVEQPFAGEHRLRFAVAYYDFQNVEGELNTDLADPANRSRVPRFVQKGNTVFNVRTDADALSNPLLGLASKFRELNVTGSFELAAFDPTRVVITGDYVKNLGYDRDEIRDRTGGIIDQEPKTTGYFAGVTVGRKAVAKRGDWQVSGGYKYLERDAVVDAFTDSDFHLGGTDAKGWVLGASYGIDVDTWLRLRWLTADAIDGPPLAIDVLQLDLNARF